MNTKDRPMPNTPQIPESARLSRQVPTSPSTTPEPFQRKYNWLILSPLIVVVFANVLPTIDGGSLFEIVVGLVSYLPVLILYGVQVQYIHRQFPGRSFKSQLYLAVGGALLLVAAAALGDVQGSVRFDDTIKDAWIGALPFAGGLIASSLLFFSLGNMLFIATKGQSNAARIFSRVCYVIGWLAIAAISYFAYAISYSAHDPNTE